MLKNAKKIKFFFYISQIYNLYQSSTKKIELSLQNNKIKTNTGDTKDGHFVRIIWSFYT